MGYTPKHYGFLLENGLSVIPPQELDERAKRPRSTSSHRSKSKPRNKKHNRESDEEDLRDKLDREKSRGRRQNPLHTSDRRTRRRPAQLPHHQHPQQHC